ncbi:hypothetical protein ACT4R9_08965 [Ornithobacterium rhinotracheale]|uniref:hypothetical protein n=1 Tax=Ornithobacterium rhinotracheale TaxID=28251 RepID=UPI003FA4259C
MDIYLIMGGMSILIIFSYLFDTIARNTQFPSVILLIATGIGLRFLADSFHYHIPYLDKIIPTFGTIGLILIVLEGALELKINKEKKGIIFKGFISALVILLLTATGLALLVNYWLGVPFLNAMLEVTPLAIISSAVAIPSAAGLIEKDKEFVVYESTFSDILGIILFYLSNHTSSTPTENPTKSQNLLPSGHLAHLF